MRNPALDAWGDYDRDDPYPLFAQVQADGPVHAVTLADGHRAWLIVRHEEAKTALNHAALSKDMRAALARDGAVVAEGLPGPGFARHMLSVDPPDHPRLRRLVGAGRVLADGLDCAYIADVAVHPAHQGRGLGKAIIRQLVALSQGHKKIILYANPGTEGFYGKLGFLRMNTAMAIWHDPAPAIESGLLSAQP